MELINIQTGEADRSTKDVIEWLQYKTDKLKLNLLKDTYRIEDLSISFSNTKGLNIFINDKKIDNLWYRRGEFSLQNQTNSVQYSYQKFAFDEIKTPLLNFLQDNIYRNNINTFSDNNKYKLITLRKCLDLGIKIPETILTNKLEDLLVFIKNKDSIITKPIENSYFRFYEKEETIKYTPVSLVLKKQEILNDFKKNDFFLPSLFQEYIDKEFEIRSFYLEGTFKSMAIFSQQNEKTKYDFRNYDLKRPNRNIPYNLPKKIEKKLHRLMKIMQINCGSIDLIYTPKGEYVFLEINPIGQFQWLSYNCNYYIERMIATQILKKNE